MTLPLHRWGPAGAPVLVALHGFLGTGRDWASLARRLPDVQVVAPDLPGHGAAVALPDEAYTFAGAVRALQNTIATLDGAPVALLGYSMGGRLALAVAHAAPAHVGALVLESATPGLRTEPERAARRALDAERAAALRTGLPVFLRAWYQMPLFDTLTPPQRATLEAARAHGDPDELARALTGLGTGAMPDLWPALAALPERATAIVGAQDARFCGIAGRMAEASPALRVVTVPGAGHNVHLEAPAVFAEAVRAAIAPAR